MTTNKDEPSLPRWDLRDLFTGPDDSRVGASLKEALVQATAFAARYRDRVSTLEAAALATALHEYETILNEASKAPIFAGLQHAVDSENQRHGALLAFTEKEYGEIGKTLVFFGLDIAKLPEERLDALAADPALATYRNYLVQAKVSRPHLLTEELERLITDKDRNGVGTLVRFLDEELASMAVAVELDGKTEELTEATALDLLHDHDRAKRQAAAKGFTAALHDETRRLALVANALIDDKAVEDGYRHYPEPETARHLANQTNRAEVDALIGAVTESYGIVADYYRFKREVMGLDVLYDYDRYAPVGEPRAAIAWADAQTTVLDAYRRFSPTMADLAADFFKRGWIDAGPRKGKRGGAFCQYGTPDLHPYVMLNYTGRVDDVMTMAHELGHAVNARLMSHETPLNFGNPLTLAETASVFGEMLVFEDLKAKLDERDRLALIMGKIESVFATVHRQTAMFLFERDIHAARRAEGELAPERFDAMWRARQEEMFGGSVTLTDDYNRWWLYITHFWHSPFYVYSYAFGELLTLALYGKYRQEGAAFIPQYLAFLSVGSSKSPQDLTAPLGINLADPAFWRQGTRMIAEMAAEAKALHGKLQAK